jgi:hypothetical protein
MKDLRKQIELFMEASVLWIVDTDDPKSIEAMKDADVDLAKNIHLEAQTYLLLQVLDMLDNINTKLAMTNINIQDVEQAVLNQSMNKENN